MISISISMSFQCNFNGNDRRGSAQALQLLQSLEHLLPAAPLLQHGLHTVVFGREVIEN